MCDSQNNKMYKYNHKQYMTCLHGMHSQMIISSLRGLGYQNIRLMDGWTRSINLYGFAGYSGKM